MKALFALMIAALSVVWVSPAMAGGLPRTLSPEFYAKNGHHGPAKFGIRWIGSGFDKTKGIAWDGEIRWVAANRNTAFLVGLKETLPLVMNPKGAYKVKVSVVESEVEAYAAFNHTVEFQVFDGDQLVAEAQEMAINGKKDTSAQAADAIATHFEQDLVK